MNNTKQIRFHKIPSHIVPITFLQLIQAFLAFVLLIAPLVCWVLWRKYGQGNETVRPIRTASENPLLIVPKFPESEQARILLPPLQPMESVVVIDNPKEATKDK
jgi:hypothetical protein